MYGLLAPEVLPSVVNGDHLILALEYPKRHSRRVDGYPTFWCWNYFPVGVREGIRSWSDWISYEDNPIAKGEE